jgi:hypothetical protein
MNVEQIRRVIVEGFPPEKVTDNELPVPSK